MLPDHEMSYQQLISTLSSPDIQRTLREYQISHLWLVGSWAENEQTTESDIDLVYDKSGSTQLKGRGPISAKIILESLLGRSIDLMYKGAIKPELTSTFMKKGIQLF